MIRAGNKVRVAMSQRRGRGAEGAAFPGVTQTTGDGAGVRCRTPSCLSSGDLGHQHPKAGGGEESTLLRI